MRAAVLVLCVLASLAAVVAAAGEGSSPSSSSSAARAFPLLSKLRSQRLADEKAPGADGHSYRTAAVASEQGAAVEAEALSAHIVALVNSHPNSTWTAGYNGYFRGKSFDFLKASCGTKIDAAKFTTNAVADVPASTAAPVLTSPASSAAAALPASFDARQRWGIKCPSLYDIRDQSGCGSCWAVASAATMTDRQCIASDGAKTSYLSALHVLTCCGEECGSCKGGYPIKAFDMWRDRGVVTGGDFGDEGTCQPYKWEPCQHHVSGPRPKCTAIDETPSCQNRCTGRGEFAQELSKGATSYALSSSEDSIMQEIYEHGPVTAGFMVYSDFPSYRGGVYQHLYGESVGGHAIKVLGWGEENGTKYWLCANSWNVDWGIGGYFKIRRGTNEGGIESMMWSGKASKA